jgi:hypothetical protein
MPEDHIHRLQPNHTPGAHISSIPEGWRLEIPAGKAGRYRLAQLDNYRNLKRSQFPHFPGMTIEYECRASAADIPGTWGLGLWNDPFSLSLGLGGANRRFPALPNCAWFFYGSTPNYLSLRDDLPAYGFLAATFQSNRIPLALLAPAVVFMPILVIPILGRIARRLLRGWIKQDAACITVDPTDWFTCRMDWRAELTRFSVNQRLILETRCSPPGPLGLVFWIDNQYAALPADGRLKFGTLENPIPAWIEIRRLKLTPWDGANGNETIQLDNLPRSY